MGRIRKWLRKRWVLHRENERIAYSYQYGITMDEAKGILFRKRMDRAKEILENDNMEIDEYEIEELITLLTSYYEMLYKEFKEQEDKLADFVYSSYTGRLNEIKDKIRSLEGKMGTDYYDYVELSEI